MLCSIKIIISRKDKNDKRNFRIFIIDDINYVVIERIILFWISYQNVVENKKDKERIEIEILSDYWRNSENK